ncbi:MAG: sulfur carrier protein ThiS adenylyltransferase ThiF [Candidatus Aminicenantes bacterium]|jgi:sulfur carrier protein ThiS adenylyltransferase
MGLKIKLNEHDFSIPENMTVGQLRDRNKPGADILIVNGYPSEKEYVLREGDEVVLFRRGEQPQAKEMEAVLVARHSPGVHLRMKESTVGIAGLGGLGSAVSIALARMGVGELVLVDYDVVVPSNLNRQFYFVDQIGMAKTEAMSKIIKNINPYVRLTTHQIELDRSNIPGIFGNVDIVVECLDRAENKAMLMEVVGGSLPGIYLVGASGLAGYGDSNSIKTWRLGERIFIVGDLQKPAEPGLGLMAPRVGIAASHQANLVVALLVDSKEAIAQIPDILD